MGRLGERGGRTVESQGGAGEGRGQRPQMGLAGQRRAWGVIGQESHQGEALFLKSLTPALVILAPQVLEEISRRGLLSPGNLPQGLSECSHWSLEGNKQGERAGT